MRSVVFASSLTLLLAASAWAQCAPVQDPAEPPSISEPLGAQMDVGGVFGTGLGEFGDRVESVGGFAVGGNYHLGESPFRVGADWTWIWHRKETGRLLTTSAQFPNEPATVRQVDFSSYTNFVHGFLRIQPAEGRVRPYADGLLGISFISTGRIRKLRLVDTTTTREVVHSDSAASFGGRVGVMIELASRSASQEHNAARLSVDAGVR